MTLPRIPPLGRLAARARRHAGGAMAVEFALLTPILLVLATAATDLALAIRVQICLANAARAGIQYAALRGYDAAGIADAAGSATTLTPAVTVSRYCGCPTRTGIAQHGCGGSCASGLPPGSYAQVVTRFDHRPIFDFPWNQALTSGFLPLTVTLVIRIE
ncbi:TadE/TadG family type IV pilus assembly protein [Methylobacterium sp. ID0610]|uniref:TadE/TadG family type IV pilus assembly protein n=1 Tax=Methylobacterium carpenticola TaxID=3344827 RepID=UPI0036B90A02